MLDAAEVGCVVAPPGKIERPAQDRVKTGRRDGERLVRLLMMRHAEKHGPMTTPASNQTNAPAQTSLPARALASRWALCEAAAQSARRTSSPDRDYY